MSAYYESSQWPAQGQSGWDHQTPPPARSGKFRLQAPRMMGYHANASPNTGASSAIPREESTAFSYQMEGMSRPQMVE